MCMGEKAGAHVTKIAGSGWRAFPKGGIGMTSSPNDIDMRMQRSSVCHIRPAQIRGMDPRLLQMMIRNRHSKLDPILAPKSINHELMQL